MSLPNALVIGPMRSGTTWLYRYLKSRDDLCFPKGVKETFFFDRRYDKGIDWYASHFLDCGKEDLQYVMEVGPSYFHSDEAPERIRKTLGDIPLIVIYRDPVERSFSHFVHLRRYGFTSLPLREAVNAFPEIISASRYAEQLQRWLEWFGTRSLTILHHETLKTSPNQFVRDLSQALDMPYKQVPDNCKNRVNRSALPESNILAGIAWKVAHRLRGWRLHKLVEWAKQIGVKDIAMKSTQQGRPEMTDEERGWIRAHLEDDMGQAIQIIERIEEK